MNRGDDRLQSGVTNVFIVGIKGLFDVLDGKIFNCVEKLLGNFDFLILKLRLADFGNDGVYEVYHFDVLFVGSHNCLEHRIRPWCALPSHGRGIPVHAEQQQHCSA